MSINGTSIYEALGFASRVYQECNALAEALVEGLSELLSEPEVKSRYKIAEKHQKGMRWQEDAQSKGCLYHSMAYSLPLTRGRKQIPDSYLFFQISLAGDGMETANNTEPLLHIGLWEWEIDFSQGQHVFFPLLEELPSIEKNGALLRWGTQWLYTLKLCAINNSTDIKTKILEPVRLLLKGEDADPALSEALKGLEGLARYATTGSPGEYHLSFQ